MEPDRFQHSHKHYIIGILCLVTSLSLFATSVYILPYLWFGWRYSMPEFILNWITVFQSTYQFSLVAASWLVFLIFFLPALILVLVADIMSNRIDSEIHGIPKKSYKKNTEATGDKESKSLILRIVVIVILVFIASELFQWAISTSPT